MRRDMVRFRNTENNGEQCCFEHLVVCFRDTEDSQTGENCSSQGLKEQRQKLVWHLWTEDGRWN